MDLCDQLFEPGWNCWRTVHADQVGFIFEAAEYFAAVRRAAAEAENRIVILGWDLNSKIRLVRGEGEDDDLPVELGPFLEALLDRNTELEICILIWDYSVVYATEREWTPLSETLRNPHPRLHFIFDDKLPITASHHQKVILIDDRLGFTGGIDLSLWRWDTEEHSLDDERRTDPSGERYDPYHDIQMVVSGDDAIGALAELCEYRWKRATGNSLPAIGKRDPEVDSRVCFPSLSIVIDGVDAGLARTYAAYEPYPGILEIEQLHLDIIEEAERYIYLENQYLSSNRIAEALAERLKEKEGPEVVIVLNKSTGGWLEESTMGVVRDYLFERLTDADRYGRLRLFYPVVYDDAGVPVRVYVHAKVIVADDCLLKIGSANLSNRSMRVDSELDVVIADCGRTKEVIAFRNHLIGLHFGKSPGEIASAFDSADGFCATLDSLLSENGSSLRVIDFTPVEGVARKMAQAQILDPDEPMDPQFWIRSRIAGDERPPVMKRFLTLCGVLALGISLVALAKWGWGDLLEKESIESMLEAIRASPWSLAILVLLFVVAGLVAFPLNILVVASVVVFGPFAAFCCGFGGAFLAAMIAFGVGRIFGEPLLEKFPSKNVQKLERHLSRRGVLSVALIRLLPIAPFTIVNLVAGSLKLKFSTFNLGTLLGMFPGILAVTILTHQVENAIVNPGWGTLAMLFAVFVVITAVLFFIWRSLKSPSRQDRAGEN